MGNPKLPESRAKQPAKHDAVSLGSAEDPHAEWVAKFANYLLSACVVVCILVAFIELT
jgi:hypothetical protein